MDVLVPSESCPLSVLMVELLHALSPPGSTWGIKSREVSLYPGTTKSRNLTSDSCLSSTCSGDHEQTTGFGCHLVPSSEFFQRPVHQWEQISAFCITSAQFQYHKTRRYSSPSLGGHGSPASTARLAHH
jgi:hypothetical protein